ncbi:MAG: HDIG domain-containing metalloprotein [Waddliaceae bacterium]
MNGLSRLEHTEELKFSREQGFFEKSQAIRAIIGTVFFFSLFGILHFQEEPVEVLELNSTAPRYIVTQTDIDFFDEEATIILKQEAVRDIGSIYRFPDAEVRKRRRDFDNFLVSDKEWRQEVPGSTFNDMYKGGDMLEKSLLTARLTDPRTLHKMQELDLPAKFYLSFTPSDEDITRPLTKETWAAIQEETFPEGQFDPKTADFIVNYFQNTAWELEKDLSSRKAIRRKIQAQIPDIYTHISAGSRMINQGEKVTSRHLAILQAMKKALKEQRHLWSLRTLAGSVLLTAILTGICIAFFYAYFPHIVTSNRKLFLVVTIVILTFGIAKLTEFFFLNSTGNLIEVIRYPLFVPFSAILLCSLLSPFVATFTSAFLTIILMMTLAFDRQEFMILNIVAAIVAILSASSLRQRREIFIICGKVWLACIGVIISFQFYQNAPWKDIITDTLSSGGFMLLTAVLVVGLLPLLESSFRIMTDVTLMEYMDPNHDLLRRLSIEAPGTYQHSVVVGNLAEAAALAINANGLFSRVATLYHDVGKMATPQYFTENQHGGMNIHQLLTPQESAQVIIAHVPEGVTLARKAGLPEQFIDVIKEHHGTTLVYYFYRKQLEKMGGDKSKIDEKEFRYAGPTPRSKESAIIMIADSLEAASRSLEKFDEEKIMDLTTRIINEKSEDGQFDHALLTLEELAVIKEVLVKTLAAYGHSRVKYPKRDIGEETLRDDL